MPLTRGDRFNMKLRMMETIEDPSEWSVTKANLLLLEFGCKPVDPRGSDAENTFVDRLADLSDADLIEMYSVMTGEPEDQVSASIRDSGSEIWEESYVRVFLSHSAQQRELVGEVADELAVSGIHAFVAHETVEVEQPWQDQIEEALRSMQAFVAMINPEFTQSAWCQQELGWALGRGVPIYALRIPTQPAGFIGRTQWPEPKDVNAKEIAQSIVRWVSGKRDLSTQIVDVLLAALGKANNYMDAGATAKRIATINTLTPSQWEKLASIYWSNNQVERAGLVARALTPYYERHGRTWPPEIPPSEAAS